MEQTLDGSDPRFVGNPLNLPRIQFTPRLKVGLQVAVTTILLAALYMAYKSTPKILNSTPWTGFTMPEDTDIPGWVLLLMPILAIIPAVYIFLFLKYNVNAPGS